MTEGMLPDPNEVVDPNAPQEEVPEEEGEKYDGGEIPRHVSTEQEDEN